MVGGFAIQGGGKVQLAMGQEVADLDVFDGREAIVEHRHLLGNDIQRHDFIVLGQQHGVGEADVAGAGDSNLHGASLRCNQSLQLIH